MAKASLITHSIENLFEGFKLGSLGISKTPKVSRDEEPVTPSGKIVPKVWGQETFGGTGNALTASWYEIFDYKGYTSISKFSYFTGKRLASEDLVGKQISLRLSNKLMTQVTNLTLYCLEFIGYMDDTSSPYDRNMVLKGYFDNGGLQSGSRKLFLQHQKIFTTKGLRAIDPREWRLTEPVG